MITTFKYVPYKTKIFTYQVEFTLSKCSMLCNHCIVDKNWAKIHKTLFKPIVHKIVPKWRLGDSKAYSMGRPSLRCLLYSVSDA